MALALTNKLLGRNLIPWCPKSKIQNFLMFGQCDFSVKKLKVTLFSAPVSSGLSFCKTMFLRKQFISPILFGLPTSGKKNVVLYSLGNRKMHNCNVSFKASFSHYFQKFLLISEKWIYHPNYLKFLVFLRYILS